MKQIEEIKQIFHKFSNDKIVLFIEYFECLNPLFFIDIYKMVDEYPIVGKFHLKNTHMFKYVIKYESIIDLMNRLEKFNIYYLLS